MSAPLRPKADRPSIRDVATAAGVSIATVSRALKNQPGLTEVTRQQILDVAQSLGYNLTSLKPNRIKRMGFFIHREHTTLQSNPFYFPVLHGAESICNREEVILTYSSVDESDAIGKIVDLHGLDALMLVGYFTPEVVQRFLMTGRPMVLVDHHHQNIHSVNTDNFMGAYLVTQHLIAMGKNHIAFIDGQGSHYSIQQRFAGFLHALQDAGRDFDERYRVARDPVDAPEGAYLAMEALLELPQPPDAVFAFNDMSALVAIKACQDHGIKVPEQVAVVGFDNIPQASHSHPSLTTVHVDKEVLGREGARLLMGALEPRQVVIPVQLMIRQSSRLANKRRRR